MGKNRLVLAATCLLFGKCDAHAVTCIDLDIYVNGEVVSTPHLAVRHSAVSY